MRTINHLLCTHCTFGTSLLEAATADQATKVLGYSVRASSIADRARLRDEFRAAERLLSYDLPRDASPHHKTQLNATTAPVKLCFIPDLNGRQVVSQITYRTYDTAGRPGSYFAHVLMDAIAEPWSALDCLRLWGISDPTGCRGWAHTDTDAGFSKLTPLASVVDWLTPDRCWVSDNTAQEFLNTGKCAKASQPGDLIPSRWSERTTNTDRIALIECVLQAILDKNTLPSVSLAIEPSMAALCFYAALRLTPNVICKGVGFSTYEPDPSRAPVRLAATTFLGSGNDFPPQYYQSDSLVINTFAGPPFKTGSYKPKVGAYAKWAVQRLAKGELSRVDEVSRLIDRIWNASRPSSTELNQLPLLDEFYVRLFRGQSFDIPAGQTAATLRFLALRCSQAIRTHIRTLASKSPETAAPLVKKLETIFRAAPQEWNRLKQHDEIADWIRRSQPLQEEGVLEKLAQPASILPDREAAGLIASSECVTKDGRLPRISPSSQRLWGNLGDLRAGVPYVVQPLFLEVLQAIEPTQLARILPKEPLPVQVVIDCINALRSAMDALPDDAGAATRAKRLRGHVRRVLDDFASAPDQSETNPTGISEADFESLLQAAAGCQAYYDPTPGAFGSRVSRFIMGFRQRVSSVCVDDHLIRLADTWVDCASDRDALRGQLRGWKTILSWFATTWDKSGKVPFKEYWKRDPTKHIDDEVRDAAISIVPGIGATHENHRQKVLDEIVDTYAAKGWLEPRKGIFSKSKRLPIRQQIQCYIREQLSVSQSTRP